MTISAYDIGDQVRMDGTFSVTDTGVLTDPTAVTCVFRENTASSTWTETVYTYGTDSELTKLSTGKYRLTLTMTKSGTHFYRFKGTGAVVTAGEMWFRVNSTEFDNT